MLYAHSERYIFAPNGTFSYIGREGTFHPKKTIEAGSLPSTNDDNTKMVKSQVSEFSRRELRVIGLIGKYWCVLKV